MSGMSAPGGGRKPLGAGWITFIVIDVILVVAVLIVAIVVFTGGGRGDDSVATGPTSSAAPQETEASKAPQESGDDASSSSDEVTTVASPSGNIVCTITEDEASCSIAELAKKPKKDKSCDGSIGYVYSVSADGVETPCADSKPGKAASDVKVLEYGQTASAFGFTCSSEEAGMGCSDDASGHGFRLARAGAQVD